MNITAGSSFTHRVASSPDTSSQRKVEPLTQPGVAHAVDSKAADQVAQRPGQNNASKTVSANQQNEDTSSNSAERTEAGKSESLSAEDQRIVENLEKRDREVRAHEAAHLSAAGGLAQGGARLQYTNGPDGRRYATSGEVSIDTSKADTPQASIIKAQRIRAAALAPAQPSAQDQRVSAQASQMAVAARAEAANEQRAERQEDQESSEQNQKTAVTSDKSPVNVTRNVEGKARTEAAESNSEEKAVEVRQVEANAQVREYNEVAGDISRPSGSGRIFNLVA